MSASPRQAIERGEQAAIVQKSRSKYGAVRTKVDGVTFASKAEARRYGELKMLERADKIHDLVLQPKFSLDAALGERIGEYRGDFQYCDCNTPHDCRGTFQVEDVKGFDTPLSAWKRKHVAAQYGITVVLVK